MTSAQVNNAKPGLIDFMGRENTNLSIKNDIHDFSKLMQEKNIKTDTKNKASKNEISTDSQSDSNMVISKVKNTNKLDKPTKTEKIEEGKLQETIEKAVNEVKKEIADTLEISVEELERVMETIGVFDLTLLDFTQLSNIFAEIIGEDTLTILTNEELSGTLNELMMVVNGKVEELAEELDILPEEVVEVLNNREKPADLKNVQLQDETITEEKGIDYLGLAEKVLKDGGNEKNNFQLKSQDEKTAGTNELENVVEVTNIDISKNEIEKDKSSNAETNDNKGLDSSSNVVQNFAETVLNNLETAVSEIAYTEESADAEGIMKQIINQVKVGVGREVTTMELQLHPESLGKLDLQVAMKDGMFVAKITTENEVVKNVIEAQLIQLKETLEEQGLKVSSVEVSVAKEGLRQDLSQNSENNGNFNETKKQSNRKINLQGITNLEDMELDQMDEKEQIAAKMMLENGNTVDYTA